jgi:hypothetical protein
MELVGVRRKVVPATSKHPEASVDTPPRVWQNRQFWFYVRIGVFITVFIAVFLLFPRYAH